MPLLNSIALGIFAILIMVGLIEAPWQVLLLILVLATLLCQWMIRRSHLQSVLEDLEGEDPSTTIDPQNSSTSPLRPDTAAPSHAVPSDNASMSYRGASYKAPSANRAGRSLEVVGKYRGRLWRSGS